MIVVSHPKAVVEEVRYDAAPTTFPAGYPHLGEWIWHEGDWWVVNRVLYRQPSDKAVDAATFDVHVITQKLFGITGSTG